MDTAKMNKFLVTVFCITLSCNAFCFEIKPICQPLAHGVLIHKNGAYCSEANAKTIHYKNPSKECLSPSNYAVKGHNQAIHEAITRIAYERAFKKPLLNYNYLQPLLSGVEWNDDPRQLIRKLGYDHGVSNIKKFSNLISKESPENDITIRSHYGDMQFLHAMRPKGMEGSSPEDVKAIVYEWIRNTYAVAKGDIAYDKKISETYFYKYFKEEDGYYQISDIFDPRKFFVVQKYDVAIQRLASGSILHIIQDSYSSSHAIRNPDNSWNLEGFFHYPNDNHCLSDTGSTGNKENIEQAIKTSTEYMLLKDQSVDWCSEMSPFIKKVFGMEAYEDASCSYVFEQKSVSLSS